MVGESEKLASCSVDADIPRVRDPSLAGAVDPPNIKFQPQFVQVPTKIAVRAVVADDDLELTVLVLIREGFELHVELGHAVVHRDDDGNKTGWHVSERYFTRCDQSWI